MSRDLHLNDSVVYTPVEIVLNACDVVALQYPAPPQAEPNGAYERFKEIWLALYLPDFFNGWTGFFKWLSNPLGLNQTLWDMRKERNK